MSSPYEDDGLEKGLLLPGETDAAAKKTAADAFRSRMVRRDTRHVGAGLQQI